jgi:IS30 family transposase
MFWSEQDEKQLQDLVAEHKSIDEIAVALNRSPEAISMKLSRLGLVISEKSSVENASNKVTEKPTTTTAMPKLEIAKREELPSGNDAIGLLWAALRRLQEPDVSKDEAKKLRLIIQGVKSYIHLEADYLLRMRLIESETLSEWKHLAASWKIQLSRAQTPEDKAKYENLLGSAQEHIKQFIEACVKEVKEIKEVD